jgi:hypothetical protein
VEPENGSLSGAAVVGSDTTASGGKYVSLGSSGTTAAAAAVTAGAGLTPPIRAAFYYPLFPEGWTVSGSHVANHPSLGYYDSSAQSVVDAHIKALDYANVKVAIASWWGQGTHQENTRVPQLLARTQSLGSPLKWSFYYEKESSADPTVAEIQSDLQYIKANYTKSPSYAFVGGKPVLFVDNSSSSDQSCALADKWTQANASYGFYLDLKAFSGFATCANQPSSWHQYSSSNAATSQAGYSYAISPGYWPADETTPSIARDPARWTQNVSDMVASKAPWQLITSFNDWGSGTAAEAADEWNAPSGYGTYLDALHNKQ